MFHHAIICILYTLCVFLLKEYNIFIKTIEILSKICYTIRKQFIHSEKVQLTSK